jgi:hypothetical protein
MIPGNHDANLNNSDRLDALTPVVNAINEKNLIYLKDTEIRTIGGVDFYHWSVLDNIINYFGKNEKLSKLSLDILDRLNDENISKY